MYKYFICIIFSFFFVQSFAQKVPQSLDQAVAYFEKHWSEKEKKNFKEQDERHAVSNLHMSTGMWIRNKWIRTEKDTSLRKQFNSMGIYHPDDISSIILTSLHRKLNNVPLDLEAQVQKYKDYWKPIFECKQKTNQIAVQNYNKYNVGDAIKIYMPVDVSKDSGGRNAVLYDCPGADWDFNPNKDLLVEAVITEKYIINSNTNVFFKVKIVKMNFENTQILMKDVKLGDEYDFHLNLLRIESN